jgi:hypothetical protein
VWDAEAVEMEGETLSERLDDTPNILRLRRRFRALGHLVPGGTDSRALFWSNDDRGRERRALGRRSLGKSAYPEEVGTGGTEMLSEEAQIGKRVRVRKDYRTATWRGREGTIEKSWGDPTYTALDVLLDDGISQLFWHHELEEVGASGA